MVRDELSVLSAFLAVAEEKSFTRAAKRLGVSTSALSHAIRGLEEQIGVRLLARTTRSVAPTEAGDQLLARLRPALGDIRGALDQVSGPRDQPTGRVRLVRSAGGATPGEWRTPAGARRLVPAVRRLFSVLPESAAAARCALGADRNASPVAACSIFTDRARRSRSGHDSGFHLYVVSAFSGPVYVVSAFRRTSVRGIRLPFGRPQGRQADQPRFQADQPRSG
jgi:molybdenum-dependent DNA-binding transcriptional regulator ModE